MSEDGGMGYWRTLLMILGICIGLYIISFLCERFIKSCPTWIPILCFWLVYILTRPLGACIGDFLTASRYVEYDPTNCNDIGSSPDDVGCEDPDVFCVTNCASYPLSTLRFLAKVTNNTKPTNSSGSGNSTNSNGTDTSGGDDSGGDTTGGDTSTGDDSGGDSSGDGSGDSSGDGSGDG